MTPSELQISYQTLAFCDEVPRLFRILVLTSLHCSLIFILGVWASAGYGATSARLLPATTQTQDGSSSTRHIRARSNDTLAKISRRLNIPVAELVRLNGITENTRLPKGMKIILPEQGQDTRSTSDAVSGKRITLADGYSFEADEVWKDGDEIWFRKGNVSQRVSQTVASVKPIFKLKEPAPKATPEKTTKAVAAAAPVWIHLVGGARFRVDEVQETGDGAWYNRGNLSVFLERERIARIEREMPGVSGPRNNDWTSGNSQIDQLIKANGAEYDIDPYLIFLVIEHESHFRQRAVSPKGARGLMQLMPSTARRLGVRNPFDVAQNIMGGSRYLKELLTMFEGRVDLALASYNAGEGAVLKYGRAVPPYRETRDYVKRITKRYGQTEDSQLRNVKGPGLSGAQ
jgi:soluble lytic murein transglycosylase-like protein